MRERADDIPVITSHFIEQLQNDLGRPNLDLSNDAIGALLSYNWPGNIRELRNVLERAALLADCGIIRANDLRFQLATSDVRVCGSGYPVDMTLQELEIKHITTILNLEGGSVDRAALKLGISRSSLYARIKQHGIPLKRGFTSEVRVQA